MGPNCQYLKVGPNLNVSFSFLLRFPVFEIFYSPSLSLIHRETIFKTFFCLVSPQTEVSGENSETKIWHERFTFLFKESKKLMKRTETELSPFIKSRSTWCWFTDTNKLIAKGKLALYLTYSYENFSGDARRDYTPYYVPYTDRYLQLLYISCKVVNAVYSRANCCWLDAPRVNSAIFVIVIVPHSRWNLSFPLKQSSPFFVIGSFRVNDFISIKHFNVLQLFTEHRLPSLVLFSSNFILGTYFKFVLVKYVNEALVTFV